MAEESRPEDPRALAERLAREAKARLAAQKVAEARARVAQAAPSAQPQTAPSEAPKKSSLAERAGQIRKPMSAKEALAAAIAAENQAATDPAAQPRVAASPRPPVRTVTPDTPSRSVATRPAAPAPASQPVAATSAPAAADVARAASLVATLLPGVKLEGAPVAVLQPEVFRALWQAHGVRAVHEKDWSLVSTASVLADAVDRVPLGGLFAARVTLDGQSRAIFLDLDRKALLGVVAPPEIYLAGL